MSEDPIKLLSGSGVTINEKTLEEYLDEQAFSDNLDSAEKLLKAVHEPVYAFRSDKRARGVKQKYSKEKITHIFTKREIYTEYKGVILMELAKSNAPLSKLVVQSLLDGIKKEPSDIIKEINENSNTDLVVNIGSVSSVLTKLKRSDLGLLIKVYKVIGKTVQPLQMHELAANVSIDDAHKLYANKLRIEEVIKMYPELKNISKVKMHLAENENNDYPPKELPKELPVKSTKYDKAVSEMLLEIMLRDCKPYSTNDFATILKNDYNRIVHTNTIATQLKSFRDSQLKDLIIKTRNGTSIWHSLAFEPDCEMDVETLLSLYRKNSQTRIEDLEKSHPKVWKAIYGETEEQEKETKSIVKFETIESEVSNESLSSLIEEAVAKQLKQVINGVLRETLSSKLSDTLDIKVSGGIDINFSFKKG